MSKQRKITLYSGEEQLSALAIPQSESTQHSLKILATELERTPVLTHAIFRDRAGQEWRVARDAGMLQRLRVLLLAK